MNVGGKAARTHPTTAAGAMHIGCHGAGHPRRQQLLLCRLPEPVVAVDVEDVKAALLPVVS